MKKIFTIVMMSMLSGCACLDGMCGDDDETLTPAPQQQTAYRGYNQAQDYRMADNMYIYNAQRPRPVIIYRQPEVRQMPVYQVEVQESRPAPVIVKTTAQNIPVTNTVVTTSETGSNASCGNIRTTVNESTLPNSSAPCPGKIKEVREPYEIVFKKTTYKTVYEPKTTSTVTYEKEPYKAVVNTQTVETVTTTTTTTTEPEVMPADEIK